MGLSEGAAEVASDEEDPPHAARTRVPAAMADRARMRMFLVMS
jgi:hypothetical protein